MPSRQHLDYALVGFCGSVAPETREKMIAAAGREGVSPAGLVGRVLDEYARGLPAGGADPRQMTLLDDSELASNSSTKPMEIE
jgi:hypothetical protein